MAERIIVLDTQRSDYNIKDAADASMTVEEFIEELRYLPMDSKIVFRNDGGYTYGYIIDRYINSENYEEETNDDEDAPLTTADMVREIEEKVRKNDNKPVPVWAAYDEAEAVSVGYSDSGILGVALDNGFFRPIEELTGDEVYEIWNYLTML